jgi:hypothetical protein
MLKLPRYYGIKFGGNGYMNETPYNTSIEDSRHGINFLGSLGRHGLG